MDTDATAEIIRTVEHVVRMRRTHHSSVYYGTRGNRPDPRWPLGSATPHNTLRGFLLQTTEWLNLQSRLGRRPYHGETSRAIDAVLVALALEG